MILDVWIFFSKREREADAGQWSYDFEHLQV